MLDATDPRTLDLWIALAKDGETVEEFVERTKLLPVVSTERVAREVEESDREFIARHTQLIEDLVAQAGEEIASTDNPNPPAPQQPADNPSVRPGDTEHA